MTFGSMCFLTLLYPIYLGVLGMHIYSRAALLMCYALAIVTVPPTLSTNRWEWASLVLMGLFCGALVSRFAEVRLHPRNASTLDACLPQACR